MTLIWAVRSVVTVLLESEAAEKNPVAIAPQLLVLCMEAQGPRYVGEGLPYSMNIISTEGNKVMLGPEGDDVIRDLATLQGDGKHLDAPVPSGQEYGEAMSVHGSIMMMVRRAVALLGGLASSQTQKSI